MGHASSDEVIKLLNEHERRGYKVDSRVMDEVIKPWDLFLLTLQDEESFLSLIWQAIDPTRLLTPNGQSRTLRDVADRMIEKDWTFKKLASPMALPESQHNPHALKRFEQIDNNFDFSKFGILAVVPANDSERNESPAGTFYIYDGVCRSLVFAHRLLTKRIHYEPVEVLLLTPRRK